MKVLYVLRPHIGSLPPVISQLNALIELGHEVTILTSCLNEEDKSIVQKLNLRTIQYEKKERCGLFGKIASIIKFRKCLKKTLNSYKDYLIWVGSGDTAFYGKKMFIQCNKIVLNIYELYDQNMRMLLSIKNIAQKSSFVVVPEYCRANILSVWLELSKRPVVIPNSPHYFSFQIEEQTKELVAQLESLNKKIILYQGWIGGQRNIAKVAQALNCVANKDDYCLVVMGKCGKEDAVDLLRKEYDRVIHIPHLSPPQHLFITQMAYIGIATYDDSSLNNVFCAPNKIYEYCRYGVPILARDIPGLKYVVEQNEAGVCVDIMDVDSIKTGIETINNNYNVYSKGAQRLYDSVDIKSILDCALKNT